MRSGGAPVDARRPRANRSRWVERWRRARAETVWLADVPQIPSSSPLYATVATAFHVTAGLLAIGVAWLIPECEHPVWITVIGACGLLSGLGSARTGRSVPIGNQRLTYLAGPPFVALMVVLGGPNHAGHALFWLFCFMPLRAFLFFSWPWALGMAAWAGTVAATTTFGFHVVAGSEWWAASTVGLVTMVAVCVLVYHAAEASWEPITRMLSRSGFDRALRSRQQNAAARFSIAVIKLEPRTGPASSGDGRADALARRVAEHWLPAAPANVRWARIADLDFAIIWDGDSAGLEEYLNTLGSALDWATLAIGFADHHRSADRAEVLHAAYEGQAFSVRTGGGVTRAGPIEAQVEELHQALLAGHIVPQYQPIVDLDSGEIVGAEALARWHHPERGWIPPDRFIPLAEHARLVDRLGEHILRHACQDAASWHRRDGQPPTIAVNVSGCQLHDPRFVDLVATVIAEAGLAPTQLTLEITESTVAADDPVVHDALVRLRAGGVQIAIDDFGTGYSSAARLVNLPVDKIKIDQEFVRLLDAGHPILQYMVALATSTGLSAVVEGIERVDQAAAISAFGAAQAQGWLFGPAVANELFPLAGLPASRHRV